MNKPILPEEVFADTDFPALGVDLSLAYGARRSGTTRLGANVRLYEPSTGRGRGGSRPGLSRYIDGRVGGDHLVQHLNYVVDPQAQALPDYDPPGGVTGGPNPFGGGYGLSPPAGDGTYPDPYGGTVRFGGTGIRRAKGKRRIAFVQATAGGTASPSAVAYPSAVTAGNLLVVSVVEGAAANATDTAAVTDSLGNTYHQIGGYVTALNSGTGRYVVMSLWYCVSAFTGVLTVTATASTALENTAVGVMEYSGTSAAPLDAAATNSDVTLALPVAAGSVTVSTGGELVVGVFGFYFQGSAGVSSFTSPASNRSGGSGFGVYVYPADVLGAASATAIAGTQTSPGHVWCAVAASFKKA